jgi:hypothetical protein
VSTFLLGLSRDSHCMNCNKLWNREVLLDVMGKGFVNGKHKWHRENLLFEREKSLFPQTQPLVVRENRWRELAAIKAIIVQKVISETGMKPAKWHPYLKEYQQVVYTLRDMEHIGVTKSKRKFVRKCPSDGCQGFLSTQWKCGLCEKHICKECNEEKGPGHKCDPGNVETVKLLSKDTKPCPKCGEMIFKASGCSQMWCTSCHCTFDWNTMKIETGNIHNPHYYEYQRKNGTLQRNPGDNPCGGGNFPLWYVYIADNFATGFLRLCHHIEALVLRRHQEADNLENRKSFMRGEISVYQFKFRIQKNEKHREKVRDIRNIHEMFINVSKDLFAQLDEKVVKIPDFEDMAKNLMEYTNESLQKIKVLYDNCVMEFIDVEKLEIVSDSKKRKVTV